MAYPPCRRWATPPGHQVVLVNSGGEKAMLVGDLLHCIAQVSEPSWCASVDYDKAASQANREMLLDKAESEGWIVCAGHFPPGQQIGRVVTEGWQAPLAVAVENFPPRLA